MKEWSFAVDYLVTRICTIQAETVEEAKELWNDYEWSEGHESDCQFQQADEPDWNKPDVEGKK
jgi:hypothetical protein